MRRFMKITGTTTAETHVLNTYVNRRLAGPPTCVKNDTVCEERVDRFYEERYFAKYRKMSHALDLLEDAPKANEQVKQTFVFVVEQKPKTGIPVKVLQQLKQLQEEKYWEIISYCAKGGCPDEDWIPRYRIVESEIRKREKVKEASMQDLRDLRDLVDLIREPHYNSYKFQQALRQSN